MPHPLEWFLFAALAILTGSFTIRIAAVEASISVADTFFIASALLFGPAPGSGRAGRSTASAVVARRARLERVAFNTVAPALSLWVGGARRSF